MEFTRQEYWNRLPFPSPGDLPNPGIEPGSPTLQADSLLSEPLGKSMLSVERYLTFNSIKKIDIELLSLFIFYLNFYFKIMID